jgi:uncharacterized integral membrane protein
MESKVSEKALRDAFKENPDLIDQIRNNPDSGVSQAFREAHKYSLTEDKLIYWIVVSVLSIVLLVVVVAAALLAAFKTEVKIPSEIIALASAALGALAGLLAPSPVSGRES